METDAALEGLRTEMLRRRGLFLWYVLPLWLVAGWLAWTRLPSLLLPAQGVVLAAAAFVWQALYRFARAAGGERYARVQLVLTILLTPVAFAGIWAMPLLVVSDAEKGVARLRGDTAAPLWFVALDTLVVAVLLLLGVAFVGWLGLVGLLVAAITVPVLYKGFRVATRAARA